jgi:putative dimethyl sulfoxide reductase chaperone
VHTSIELKERAATYRLLAQLYRQELTEPLAKRIIDTEVLDSLARYGYEKPADFADKESLGGIRQEFTKVFLGPGKHIAPYGSVHHPDDPKRGQLWGETTTKVRVFAKEHGLSFEGKAYDGMPDHIGLELELFALLLEGQADAVAAEESDKVERIANSQRYLHGEHLNRWIPVFCDKVEKETDGLYAAIARLTRDLLGDEGERLGEV